MGRPLGENRVSGADGSGFRAAFQYSTFWDNFVKRDFLASLPKPLTTAPVALTIPISDIGEAWRNGDMADNKIKVDVWFDYA